MRRQCETIYPPPFFFYVSVLFVATSLSRGLTRRSRLRLKTNDVESKTDDAMTDKVAAAPAAGKGEIKFISAEFNGKLAALRTQAAVVHAKLEAQLEAQLEAARSTQRNKERALKKLGRCILPKAKAKQQTLRDDIARANSQEQQAQEALDGAQAELVNALQAAEKAAQAELEAAEKAARQSWLRLSTLLLTSKVKTGFFGLLFLLFLQKLLPTLLFDLIIIITVIITVNIIANIKTEKVAAEPNWIEDTTWYWNNWQNVIVIDVTRGVSSTAQWIVQTGRGFLPQYCRSLVAASSANTWSAKRAAFGLTFGLEFWKGVICLMLVFLSCGIVLWTSLWFVQKCCGWGCKCCTRPSERKAVLDRVVAEEAELQQGLQRKVAKMAKLQQGLEDATDIIHNMQQGVENRANEARRNEAERREQREQREAEQRKQREQREQREQRQQDAERRERANATPDQPRRRARGLAVAMLEGGGFAAVQSAADEEAQRRALILRRIQSRRG